MKNITFVFILVCCLCHSIFAGANKKEEVEFEFLSENLNDKNNNFNPLSTPPPANDICTGAIDIGLIECGFDFEYFLSDPEATPDPEATGNCVSPSEPALWYTFTTPDPLPYTSISNGVTPCNVEIFSSTSGCDDLVYEGCGFGAFTFEVEAGTTYYILATNGLYISLPAPTGTSECNWPIFIYNSDENLNNVYVNTSCETPSSIVPCENDHVVWYAFISDCITSDILINVDENSNFPNQTADEASITVFYDDCTTLMSDYDANGLGYVCSGLGASESILLEDIPPSTEMYLAFGSSTENVGVFSFTIDIVSPGYDAVNDICTDAIELEEGSNVDLENFCSIYNQMPFDAIMTGCNSQSEATVWYIFDSGNEPQDIIINISSTGINMPAIAAYNGCVGTTLDVSCSGSALELFCVDYPIWIEVGSSLVGTGTYDIEIISTPAQSELITNDTCDDPIVLVEGTNVDLTNYCASFSGAPYDAEITGCPEQSTATVWYEFDPGVNPQDITVDLISTGIISPAMAVYDGCVGETLASDCGTTLEIACIDSPILIEVGSSFENYGNFDLNITSTPSLSSIVPDIIGQDICSNSLANITIDFPTGNFADIIVQISPGSSTSISGMSNQIFNNVNSIVINDILVNTSSTAQEAIYSISFESGDGGCPPEPVEFSIFVFPDFVISPVSVDECAPYLLELDASDIVSGGTLPYSMVSWYWNSTEAIGNGNSLSYELEESGEITLEVEDNEGCLVTTQISVEIETPTIPTFDFPLEYCRSDQDNISFPQISLENIAGSWNIPVMDLSIYPDDGFYELQFTPTESYCSEPVSLWIEIYSGETPVFDLPEIICSDEGQFTFPTEDLFGVSGYWETPVLDLSSVSGIITNVFTTSSLTCSATFEHDFEVIEKIELNFNIPDSLCRTAEPITLNNVTIEGYAGNWSIEVLDPSLITGDTFSNVWTPDSGQSPCLEDSIFTIHIFDPYISAFNLPNELCSLDTSFTLPTEDNQSINGTWSIPMIDPALNTGIVQSIFTPDDACAESYTWEIEIVPPHIPEFSILSTLCSLDPIYDLPLISDNGYSGTWSLPSIDPSMHAGELISVVFQSDESEFCVESFETTIEIIEPENAIFELPEQFCWSDEEFILPSISNNGIEGSWTPSIIDVELHQGTTINSVFTPTDESCTNQLTQSFDVVAPFDAQAEVTNPSDCTVPDGSISIDIAQGLNLEFSIDGGLSWQSAQVFSALNSGAYIILVRSIDSQNCVLELEAFLNTVDGPTINNIESNNIMSCVDDNGSIIVDAVGDYLEYSIDGGITWQSSNEFENLPPDSYLIHIREVASDCIVEASALIEDFPQTEIVTIIPQDLSDCETNDGIIEILATGEALEYSIDNGLNWTLDNIFFDLSAGEYLIVVRSTIGDDCLKNAEVELIAPEMPSILGTMIQNPSQCVEGLGSMEVDALGVNLEYSIDGGITWQDSPIFTDLDVDEYQLVIRDKVRINCSDESEFSIIKEVESLAEPTFSITSPSICGSDDGVLEVTNSSTELEFSIDGGQIWQEEKIFNNLTSDVYTLITRKILLPDCRVEQIIVIPDSDCPCNDLMVTFDVDNISCIDEGTTTVELSAAGMIDPEIDITWQNGTTGANVEGLGFGWQTVTIMYDVHCIWMDSVFIDQLEPIELEWQIQDNNCPDANNGVVEVINIIGGDGNYEYSIDGVNYQKENVFTGLESRVYNMYVRDETNCLTIKEIEILTQGRIDVQLPAVEVIKIGEKILLDPILNLNGVAIDSFVWRSDEGILSTSELRLEVFPTITTLYTLVVYFGDCQEHKDITIEVLLDEINVQEDEIYLGNIFSPNGDDINDHLFIQGIPNSKIILENFRVFDRWGSELFNLSDPEFNNISEGWDGSHNGKLVNPGVYIYMIRFIHNDKSELKIGTVTLVH